MKKTIYQVTSSGEGRWVVKKQGGVRATSIHSSRSEAVSRAIELARSSGGDRVSVSSKGKYIVYRSAASGRFLAVSDSEAPPRRPPPRK